MRLHCWSGSLPFIWTPKTPFHMAQLVFGMYTRLCCKYKTFNQSLFEMYHWLFLQMYKTFNQTFLYLQQYVTGIIFTMKCKTKHHLISRSNYWIKGIDHQFTTTIRRISTPTPSHEKSAPVRSAPKDKCSVNASPTPHEKVCPSVFFAILQIISCGICICITLVQVFWQLFILIPVNS